MKIYLPEKKKSGNEILFQLVADLNKVEEETHLKEGIGYYDFPVYKGLDEDVLVAQFMILSPNHGVALFHISDIVHPAEFSKEYEKIDSEMDSLYTILYTRLLRNRELKGDKTNLKFPISSVIYAPLLKEQVENPNKDIILLQNFDQVRTFLQRFKKPLMDAALFNELVSTIEGAKGMLRASVRENVKINSKGAAVNELEKEIARFDQYQKSVFSSVISGVNRVRGLAGSGKTVVLAIKAAITHLRFPDKKIVYTFYTKSLYQHIQRLITRFYRQFDDRDPNWDNLQIMHAWGGTTRPGIYYNSCVANGVSPMTFSEAVGRSSKDVFDTVCNDFNNKAKAPIPIFDFVFIDEGQDFPTSFLTLCVNVTKEQKVFWAYDELQTIFQIKAPTPEDIFGLNASGQPNVELEDDIILYKCYRNPREILVVAHALGFGIYGKKIVQMIESEEYWKDIGYSVEEKGKLVEGEKVKIFRPEENSLASISKQYSIEKIIRCSHFNDYSTEIMSVCEMIQDDIADGLLPEDILVISVDDRHANNYFTDIQKVLASKYRIKSNNIHSDKFAVKDFQVKGQVTLSTVHKAKGNEAYSVYIVGIDTIYSLDPSIRDRNILFTAITRSKGWVSLTGLGVAAEVCCREVTKAMSKFPYLEFTYPSKKDLKIMQRDIHETAQRKSKNEKTLDDLLTEMSPEDIQRFISQRSIKKGK
ncbi:MAG TPA: ATP-binding domain-containing protein [Bacteroidia bacterium]|jgi:superfamily I DNA and RNA helicase|nr:ATP-binding domain-containing protein [Bacteroidia bacterium]